MNGKRIFGALALMLLATTALLASWAVPGTLLAMGWVGTTGPGAAPAAAPGAGAGAIPGNVNEAMKIIFGEPLTNSIVSDSELLDIFEQDMNVKVSETTGGRFIELAHYFSLPAGVAARKLEGDYIPIPSGPTIRNSQVYLKKIEGTVQMSGDTMRRVKQGPGAWVTWAKRAMPDLKMRVDHELDRMLLGYGSGARALVNDADPDDADLTITIDSALGIAGLGNPVLQFLENESIVFGPTVDGANLRDSGAAYQVLDFDYDALTLTLATEPTINVANNDFIFGGDASVASVDDRELMGLFGMVDDGTYLATFQGLARADYRLWRSHIFDAAAGALTGELTEEFLTKCDDETAIRGKGEVDTIVSSRSTLRNFWANLKDDKRLIDPKNYTGGKAKLSMLFNDKVIVLKPVRKMPDGVLFGLQRDTFKHWRNTGWEWDDTTGAIWNRVTDANGRKDEFFAVGHLVMQTGCIAPAKNFKATGILTTY